MPEFQRSWHRGLTVVGIFGLPLLCGALFFVLNAPVQDGGVYLELDRGFGQSLEDRDRSLHSLVGFRTDVSGAALEARTRSLVPIGPVPKTTSFFLVGPDGSPLMRSAVGATVWCFVVDGVKDDYRANAELVPATISRINPHAYRITPSVSGFGWGDGQIAVRLFERALAHSTGPRQNVHVMMGLELQETDTELRTMYAFLVGPPQ